MQKVGSLLIDVAANVAGLRKDFDQIKNQTSSFAKTTKKILGGLGIGYATKQLVNLARETMVTMRTLADTAHSVGTTSEKFSELSYAVGQTGTDVSALKSGYRHLVRAMGDSARGLKETAFVFDSLGIAIKDTKGNFRDTSDVIVDVADRFGQMEDATLRSYYATKLFGRSGTELIPTLAEGANGVKNWIREAKEFNIVVGEDSANSIEMLMRAFNRLKNIGTGSLRTLSTGLADSMRQIASSWEMMVRGSNDLKYVGEILGWISKQASLAAMNALFVAKFYGNAIIGVFMTIPNQINKVLAWLQNLNISQAIRESLGLKDIFQIPALKLDLGDVKEQIDQLVKQYESARMALESPPPQMSAPQKTAEFNIISPEAPQKVDQLKEKVNALITSLQQERFILQQSADAQNEYNTLKQAGLEIDTESGEIKEKCLHPQADQLKILGEEVRVLQNVQGVMNSLKTDEEKTLEVTRDLNTAYENGWITLKEYEQTLSRMTKKEAEHQEQINETTEKIIDFKSVLSDYIEEMSNRSKMVGDAFVSSFDRMRDTIVDFVRTGKLQFKDFAVYVIEQIMKIAVQQSIINPLASLAVSAFSGVFGGAAPASSGGEPLLVAHSGGIVGRGRMIPASAYSGAPRYHSGFRPNERPAILEVGEEIIPRNRAGGHGLTINVPVTVAERNPAMQSDLRREIENTVLNVIRRYS